MENLVEQDFPNVETVYLKAIKEILENSLDKEHTLSVQTSIESMLREFKEYNI